MSLHIPSADELPPLEPSDLRALPVFPLPRVVFFPGTALPLHLFEPRYRDLIQDCTTVGPNAMAVSLLLPGYEDEYERQPPIAKVSGVGRIVWHEALADGRHDVVLVGMGRAHLREMPMEGRLYRRAEASMLEDEGSAGSAELSALLSCASAVSAFLRTTHPEFSLGLDEGAAPGRIADVIADRLIADSGERQEILETLDVHERVVRVTSSVSALLAEIQLAGGGGTVH